VSPEARGRGKTVSLALYFEMIGDRSAAILNLDHRAGKRGS